MAYSKFIAEKRKRNFHEDVNTIFKALVSLRNLNNIVISHMQSWAWNPPQLKKYQELQKRIWMAPCTTNEMAAGVQTFLLAFRGGLDNKSLKHAPGKLMSTSLNSLLPVKGSRIPTSQAFRPWSG